MESWETISFKGETPLQFILDNIPEAPAIYAFTLDLNISEKYFEPNSFVSLEVWAEELCIELERILSLPHGMKLKSSLGAFESVGINYSSNFSFTYIKPMYFMKLQQENPKFISYFKAFINKLSCFSSSLYIGETKNLYTRVKKHLDSESELSARLASEGISFKDLCLKYILLDELYTEIMIESEASQEESSLMSFFSQSSLNDSGNPENKQKRHLFEELITRYSKPRFIEKIGGHIINGGD